MRLICVVFACLMAVVSAPAVGNPAGVAVVTTFAYQYLPGDSDPRADLTLEAGDRLFLANLDPLGAHNLVSLELVDDEPIFSSEVVNMGHAAEVNGVPSLGLGVYVFMCTVHGYDAMNGSLEVS